MKIRLVVVLLGIMFILGACGQQEAPAPETQAETESASSEQAAETESEEEAKEITVKLTDEKEELKDKDDKDLVLVHYDYQKVEVTIPGNESAASKINGVFAQQIIGNRNTCEQYMQWAKEDKEFRPEGEWNPYEVGLSYECARADRKVISIIADYYDYTGGAHPNGNRGGLTFDTATGNELTLDKAFRDTEDLKIAFRSFLEEELKKQEYKERLFPDFEFDTSLVDDIMTDSTWYLSKDGIVFICNEYILGPHAAGIFTFTMPYGEYGDLLNEAYLPE